jgi:IclR helix-turn-helix domain
MIEPGTMQTIDASLVRYVRKGVLHALKANVRDISDQIEIDPSALHPMLASFDKSRALFEFVWIVDEPEQADLLLDLSRWPMLLRLLESQRDREVRRLQDLAVDSFVAPLEDLPALEALISSIRQRTGTPVKARGVAHSASDADNVRASLSQLGGHAALAARLQAWRGSRLVSSLLLGLLVLASFPADRSYLTLTDVARKCSISPSTAHRYTHTLIAAGLLERDSLSRQYRLA